MTTMQILRYAIFASLMFVLETGFAISPPASGTQASDPSGGFDQQGYFTARPDLRLCPAPMCGGYFVKRVNKEFTRCADGTFRKECQVISIRWSGVTDSYFNFAKGNLLLKGFIGKSAKTLPSLGPVGVFVAQAGYRSATGKTPNSGDIFAGLRNNGILCITTPCFSYQEHVLNTYKTLTISDINLNNTGASEKQIAWANDALANGKILLAVGKNAEYSDPFGKGISFVASNFYLPIKRPTVVCKAGYVAKNGICVTPVIGCQAPLIELEGTGGAAFIDPETGEIISNITRSCVKTCEPPGILDKPAHCSVFYP